MYIEYGKDIAERPAHLSADFLLEVVENALRVTGVQLLKAHVTMGSNIGENYCSLIYRVHIEYQVEEGDETGHLWVICKCIPQTETSEFLEDLAVFQKEKVFYFEVLPRLEMLLDAGENFGCRLFHTLQTPMKTLVFEDLSKRNFRMASRESGLDEKHCRLVMKRLGKFHAASLVLAKRDPEILKIFRGGMLYKGALEIEGSMLFRYFQGNASALLELVSQWPGYEEIAKKIQTYTENLRENLWRCQAPLPGEFRVLNHGDLWVNNMLFKYNDCGKPADVLFLDLQLSVWGSPGIDLNYFFYTSMTLDLLKTKRESLLKEYHESLSSALRHLNYKDIPTFGQILQEVRRREGYGFFANYGIFPTITMDKEYSCDHSLDNFADAEFARLKLKQMFSSKRLEQTLRYTLKRFDEMGVLN